MITIGIDNTLDMAKETMQFLRMIAKKHHIKLVEPVQHHSTIYHKHKILTMKQYIEMVCEKESPDWCLIELTKDSIFEDVYKHLFFDSIILFGSKHETSLLYSIYFENKIRKHIKSRYIIMPDTNYFQEERCITYGWSKDAHVSLTSSEEGPDGKLSVQCIIQHLWPSEQIKYNVPLEFPICGKANKPEHLLVGIIVMMLSGMNINSLIDEK